MVHVSSQAAFFAHRRIEKDCGSLSQEILDVPVISILI